MIPVLLALCWLGARGLYADSVWGDEIHSLRDAGAPFFGPLTPAQIWERVATGNPWHTPFYFTLLNLWSHLAGWSAPTLRLLSLFFGLLTVAWTYRLGRDFISPRAGLYGAALLGTAAFFVHYTHELRMYTLIVLLNTFTLWAYLRIVSPLSTPPHRNREGKKGRGLFLWFGLFAGTLGTLYTHYLAALPLMVIGIYHILLLLWCRGKARLAPTEFRRRWWGVVGVMTLAGVLFLPWARVLLDGLSRNAANEDLQTTALGAGDVLVQFVTLFSNGAPGLLVVACAIAALSLADALLRVPTPDLISRDAILGVRENSQPGARGAFQIAFFAIALVVVTLLVNAFINIIAPSRMRYLLSAWGLLALLVGYGAAWVQEARTRQASSLQKIGLAFVLVWMGFGIVRSGDPAFTHNLPNRKFAFPFQTLDYHLRPQQQPGDFAAVYLPDTTEPWVYQTSLDIGNYYFNGFDANYRVTMTLHPDEERAVDLQTMTAQLAGRTRVWTASIPGQSAALGDLQTVMAADGFALCRTAVDQPDLRLDLFTRSPVCCDEGAALIRYPDGIMLTGIDPLPAEVEDALPVLMGWSSSADTPPYKYSVALHVLDIDGTLVAQADYGLPMYAFRCATTRIDVRGLPPGDYTLAVIVYAWETGARLTGMVVATGEQGERLAVGTFAVSGG